MPTKVGVPGGNEQWSISKAIAPHGNNDLDDVVLVQTMLKIFMTSPAIIDDLPASLRGTKMRELNEIWDANAITESAASKRESGRKFLSPNVFTALYPDG